MNNKKQFKEGQVIETIKPFWFLTSIIIQIFFMVLAFKINPIFCILALMFAWQNGWGMKVTRFYKEEISKEK